VTRLWVGHFGFLLSFPLSRREARMCWTARRFECRAAGARHSKRRGRTAPRARWLDAPNHRCGCANAHTSRRRCIDRRGAKGVLRKLLRCAPSACWQDGG